MRTEREPRTLQLEHVTGFLHLPPTIPEETTFQTAAKAFRLKWGLPEAGFTREGQLTWPGIARDLHEFLGMFARDARGETSVREREVIKLLDANPYQSITMPEVREKLQVHGFDFALVGWLRIPPAPPDFPAYEGELKEFTRQWVSRYACLEQLGVDAPDLILDLIYQPEVIRERLALEYRVFDYLRNPEDDKHPLIHTFTPLLPDVTFSFTRGSVPVRARFRSVAPASEDKPQGNENGTGSLRVINTSAYGELKPTDVLIRTRDGISGRALKALAAEVTVALAARPGKFKDLEVRRTPDERNRITGAGANAVTKLDLAVALGRIEAGAKRSRVIRELAERLSEAGRPLTDNEVDALLRQLARKGFRDRIPGRTSRTRK